jgi:hypothetical protein
MEGRLERVREFLLKILTGDDEMFIWGMIETAQQLPQLTILLTFRELWICSPYGVSGKICLQNWPEKWNSQDWCLCYDRVSAHSSFSVQGFMAINNLAVTPHPSYAPDLKSFLRAQDDDKRGEI